MAPRGFGLPAVAFVSATAFLGCAADPSPGPPAVVVEPEGTLVLDWSIDEATDPARCQQGSATTFDVIVNTAGGAVVGEYQEACEAFTTSIPLAPGSYVASAVLLDGSGVDRTTAVNVDPFEIFGNDQLSIPVDFPASSFR